jgi:hypothetical protein
MKEFAFISRHQLTDTQREIAHEMGIFITSVGDRDAFNVSSGEFEGYDGVIVVHPAMALRLLCSGRAVGVFENEQRGDGFVTKTLHVYHAHRSLEYFSATGNFNRTCYE